ncbi:hypothetical protein D3C75_927530 [compost metagenome]
MTRANTTCCQNNFLLVEAPIPEEDLSGQQASLHPVGLAQDAQSTRRSRFLTLQPRDEQPADLAAVTRRSSSRGMTGKYEGRRC